ncbi:MAG: isopentenyl-diphosphate Delta-isomerase [Chryseolinea sp.]
MEEIILVDEEDNAIGTMEKLEAHQKGVLHRAFSVLLLNGKGQLLLQRRAGHKYHSGGLWSNTCCSHPGPNELIEDATRKRLMYEMGIDVQPEFAFKFLYKAALDRGLIEHEYDHVFTGLFDGTPIINKDEVTEWMFVDIQTLMLDLSHQPEKYTPWLKLILQRFSPIT